MALTEAQAEPAGKRPCIFGTEEDLETTRKVSTSTEVREAEAVQMEASSEATAELAAVPIKVDKAVRDRAQHFTVDLLHWLTV